MVPSADPSLRIHEASAACDCERRLPPEDCAVRQTRRGTEELMKAISPETAELMTYTSAAIDRQLKAVNNIREVLSRKDVDYLKRFLTSSVLERNLRAEEVESEEVAEAARLMARLFQYPPFAFLCVDGRINYTNIFGFAARMPGGAIQVPAGNPTEFLPAPDGSLILDPQSNTARQLSNVFARSDEIAEILDSHLGCAAQEQVENEIGEPVKDKGLRADVERKRRIAESMVAYTAKQHPGKTVHPIQISFDPHHGYMYMGLETPVAMQASGKEGFTEEVLAGLSADETILSTESLAKSQPFAAVFEAAFETFKPEGCGWDWQKNYRFTDLAFWKAITQLRADLFPVILEKLQKIPGYATLGPKPLQERAMLVLANAFNGFVNNHDGHYPFSDHREDFVSVTERDYRPLDTMGFAVYSLDHDTMASNVRFASTIVRKVRQSAGEEMCYGYETADEFRAAPVPVIVKVISRLDLPKEDWDELRKMDWLFLQDMGTRWKKMNNQDFNDLMLAKNPDVRLNARLVSAIHRLRHKMATLYDRHEPTAELFMSGKLFALPVIADRSRRFQAFIPFSLAGYDNGAFVARDEEV